jgi:hypothetical protein
MVCLCALALVFWAFAFLLRADHIVINGRSVAKDDSGFHAYLIVWRIAMTLGGVFALALARLCYKIARDKEIKR